LVIRKLENQKQLHLMKESAGSWLLIQKWLYFNVQL